MGKRKKIIGVIGGSMCLEEDAQTARRVGELIAENGYILICGGLTGIMEATARGCTSKGGISVGILPGSSADDANEWIGIPVVTSMSHARNNIIVRSSDAIISIGGGLGTLSEIAIALKTGKDVIGINTWDVDERIIRADDAEDAIGKMQEILEKK